MNPLNTLQTSRARANDLFAELADTGPGAVKAREQLFGELREEIELLARLEHDHLLPALKKHAGTKTVVAQTAERLRGLRTRLRRLADTPKRGDAFLDELDELKAAFQQHLREDKSTLLPTLLKALSDDETVAVSERIEADQAEVEAAARREAELERATARRRREREDALHAEAEADERDALRLEREDFAAPGAAVFAQAAQQASQAWMTWAQTRLQNQVSGFSALMQCRTPADLVELQGRLFRDELQLLLETGARVSSLATSPAQAGR